MLIHQQPDTLANCGATASRVLFSRPKFTCAVSEQDEFPRRGKRAALFHHQAKSPPSAITVHLSKTLARDRTTLFLLGGRWSVKIQPEPDHSSFPGRLYCGLPAKWRGSSIYSNWCVYCSLHAAPVLLLECSEKMSKEKD